MARPKRTDGPNKMGLVRDAIAALGGDPKPKEIYEHIKAGGVDIPTAMISSYKSMILKKGKKKKGPGRPRKNAAGPVAMSAAPTSSVFDDVMTVNSLIKKHGASKLSDLIKLLAK
jgi:hypothetical protein